MRKYPYIPQPFVLRVDLRENRQVLAGDTYTFGLRLFGPAIEFAPYVIFAVQEMGRRGLGRDRIPFVLNSVHDGQQDIYIREQSAHLHLPSVRHIRLDEPSGEPRPIRLDVQFATPARLRTEGRLNRLPDLPALLRAGLRRLRVLCHFYGTTELAPADMSGLFDAAETSRLINSTLHWHGVQRYSTRQNRKMVMDGVVGSASWELSGETLLPILRAAESCHIGKATSFGFGRLTCEVNPL